MINHEWDFFHPGLEGLAAQLDVQSASYPTLCILPEAADPWKQVPCRGVLGFLLLCFPSFLRPCEEAASCRGRGFLLVACAPGQAESCGAS